MKGTFKNKKVKNNKTKKLKNKKTNKTKKGVKGKYKNGGAPERISANSYTELYNKLQNFPDDIRIWIVKKNNNNALYESNKMNILESLYDKGITNENINEYEFNVL